MKTRRGLARSSVPIRYAQNPYACLLPTEPILLKATTRREVIKEDPKVFPRGVSARFALENCNVPGPAAPAVRAVLCKMVHPRILWAFEGFAKDYDKLCLSQGQIIDFAKKYPHLVGHGYGTWMFFKVGSEFFLASLHTFSGLDPRPDLSTLSEIQKTYTMSWRDSTLLIPICF